MPRNPETRITEKIREAIATEYPKSYVRKIHGNAYQHAGIPDLICCIEGFFFGFEVKTDTGKSSRIQILEGVAIRKAGGTHAVVKSPAVTLEIIKQALDEHSSDDEY